MSILRAFVIAFHFTGKTTAAVTLLMICLANFAQSQNPTEQELKTVYIYNFVNFVEWPESAFEKSSDPFVIGIAGQEKYRALLQQVVKGETYKGRQILVRDITTISEARGCQIVFVEKTSLNFSEAFSSINNTPVLTIGDDGDFIKQGGIIRFFLENNKLRIEINQKKAEEHGLVISSKLLRLAKLFSE